MPPGPIGVKSDDFARGDLSAVKRGLRAQGYGGGKNLLKIELNALAGNGADNLTTRPRHHSGTVSVYAVKKNWGLKIHC